VKARDSSGKEEIKYDGTGSHKKYDEDLKGH
jgi:hypothetical protein